MKITPPSSHQFGEFFEADDSLIFRITFECEDILRLRSFFIVDPSINEISDQWTALVVEPIAGKHPDFHRLFHSGSGIDFVESDITEIFDEKADLVIYRRDA